ncbi:MAG: hypothetical protein ACFFB3_16830 [Candidatus Hodarchaeota archaeon]
MTSRLIECGRTTILAKPTAGVGNHLSPFILFDYQFFDGYGKGFRLV